MNSYCWSGAVAASLLSFSAAASAQQAVCSASDVDCRGSQVIINVLNQKPRDQGLREFAVGTVCRDDDLIRIGRANYDRSIQGLIADVQRALRSNLQKDPSGDVERLVQSSSYTVRAARNAQASGMVSGLESAFGLFPRSRAEYCARILPTLKPTPAG